MAKQSVPTYPTSFSTNRSDDIASVKREEIVIGDLLGKGRFKHVHQATFEQRDVVVFKYTVSKNEDENELRMLRLLATYKGGNHVPEIYGFCTESASAILVVQERAVHGSLKAALKDPSMGAQISARHLTFAAYQLATAMTFLEGVRIVHADLSCRNLLLCQFVGQDPCALIVKVTDFGLAIQLEEGVTSISKKQPLATRWCAPETVAEFTFSHRSDVWSYGATVWEMFAGGAVPWKRLTKRVDVGVRLKRLAKRSTTGTAPPSKAGRDVHDLMSDFPKPDGCPTFVHKMILSCFQVDVTKRTRFASLAEKLGEGFPTRKEPEEEKEEDENVGAEETKDHILEDLKEQESESQTSLSTGTPESSSVPATPEHPSCHGTGFRFRALDKFLWSSKAVELVGEDTVKEMRLEMEEVKAFMAARQGVEAEALKSETAHVLNQCQTQPWSGALWSLWTFSKGVLHQERYPSEERAWAAFFQVRKSGRPCVLRDPVGSELAALSWMSLPPQLLRTIRIA